jgi:hypothetical protein
MTLEEIMIRDCSKEQLVQNIKDLIKENLDYKQGLEYFIDRVENGTIKSKTTYKMFKDLIEKYE